MAIGGMGGGVTPNSSAPKEDISVRIRFGGRDEEARLKSFTTGDEIRGDAFIEARQDTPVDSVVITFEGHARTFLKKFSLSPSNIGSGLEAKRTFLRLVQPTPRLPQRATFRASSLYIIPFCFKVPERLPGQACIQWNARREVRAAHLAVPPTFGKQNGMDDQMIPQPNTTPNFGSISYYIRVKVVADKQINVLDETLLGETWRVLRLTPVVDEIGPLDTCNTAGLDYSASDTAYLEKARWQGTLGKVIMQVRQPKSLCLPISTGYNRSNIKSVETTVFIKLIFEPVEPDGMPPNLERLTCKLRTGTLFNTTPVLETPFSLGTNRVDGTLNGLSVASVPMLDQSVGGLVWQESVRPMDSSIQSPLQRTSWSRGFKVFTINSAVPLRLAIDKIRVPADVPLMSHLTLSCHRSFIGSPDTEKVTVSEEEVTACGSSATGVFGRILR